MTRALSLASMVTVLALTTTSCSPSETELREFSDEWKSASAQERGLLLDIKRQKLVWKHLNAKDRDAVVRFLGTPDDDDGGVAAEKNLSFRRLYYECGNMGGPYEWTLLIDLDEDGRVLRIGLDD